MEHTPTEAKVPDANRGSRSRISLAVLCLTLLAVGGAYYWWYAARPETVVTEYLDKFSAVHEPHELGDFNASIEAAEKLLPEAPTTGAKAHLTAVLAVDLWRRNQGDDRARAVTLYKDLVTNRTYDVRDRAAIVNDLAFLVGAQSRQFYLEHFNEPPFAAFLPATSSSSDMRTVMLNMFMFSDDLYPNSLAKFSIVNIYSNMIGSNQLEEGMSAEVIAKLIQDHLVAAEPLINDLPYEESYIARQRLYRAHGLAASGRVLGNVPLEVREQAYRDALPAAADEDTEIYQVQSTYMQARFFYAAFLFNNFGPERHGDIAAVLKKFEEAIGNDPKFRLARAFFSNPDSRSATDFVKVSAARLAGISPEFNAFLQSLGWAL